MAKWIGLSGLSFLVAVAAAAASLCEDDADCQHEVATKFAPVFKFDRNTLREDRCLPGHPATVYWERKANNTQIICESNLTKLEAGEVPLFYHYKECGSGVVVVDYFIWYSHQKPCLQLETGGLMEEEYGAHKGDWETVAVQIFEDEVTRVRYHQHSGCYSKSAKNIKFEQKTHPVSFVGLDSHGNYHDQGGTGNCLYFQDFRRHTNTNLKLEGWKFLIDVKNQSENLPEWFKGDRDYFDGYPAPGSKSNNCNFVSCRGKEDYIELTETCTREVCGCHRSDYCHDVEFGSLSDEKPCGQSTINELSSKGKDLLGGLFGRNAQVSFACNSLCLWKAMSSFLLMMQIF